MDTSRGMLPGLLPCRNQQALRYLLQPGIPFPRVIRNGVERQFTCGDKFNALSAWPQSSHHSRQSDPWSSRCTARPGRQ